MEGIIKQICISKRRGTEKTPVPCVHLIENYGLENDAHAGNWHRQVSLLSKAKVDEFNAKGGKAAPGDFGENILAEGIDFSSLPVGTQLKIGDALLEISQIGKECHTHCAIYQRVNDCIMPREGVFARVITGGKIQEGDTITVLEAQKKYTAAVVVCSDAGSKKQREDLSGPTAKEMLEEGGFVVEEVVVIADEQKLIENTLKRLADQRQICLIVTSGGTGFSKRDVTPEATQAVATRQAMGFARAIEIGSLQITPRAMLSRAVSVIRNESIIINLPGSPKAVRESLEIVLKSAKHGVDILKGWDGECARK
jgi:molybdenum cofactor synthesis domain-containing protein